MFCDATGRMLVTSQLVERWCRAAEEGATMGTMRQLLRVRCHINIIPLNLFLPIFIQMTCLLHLISVILSTAILHVPEY